MVLEPPSEPYRPGDLETAVGRRVRALREERGLSQQQMAEQLAALGWQVHQTTVGKIETASRPLRVNELSKLAVFFGVPIPDLWTAPISDIERSRSTVPRWRRLLESIEEDLPALREKVEEARKRRDESLQEWSLAAAQLADHEQQARKARETLARLEVDASGGDGVGQHREEG